MNQMSNTESSKAEKRIEEQIQEIIDEVVNVQLALHGGSASLTAYEDGVAWVKFHGACAGCMASSDTLEMVVKESIMGKLPEVKDPTAAGDSFLGAFMFAYLHGWSLKDCATLANATGAAAVAKMGSGTAVPTKDEVKAVLASRNIVYDL